MTNTRGKGEGLIEGLSENPYVLMLSILWTEDSEN